MQSVEYPRYRVKHIVLSSIKGVPEQIVKFLENAQQKPSRSVGFHLKKLGHLESCKATYLSGTRFSKARRGEGGRERGEGEGEQEQVSVEKLGHFVGNKSVWKKHKRRRQLLSLQCHP